MKRWLEWVTANAMPLMTALGLAALVFVAGLLAMAATAVALAARPQAAMPAAVSPTLAARPPW